MGLVAKPTPVQAEANAESANLAKHVALVQYILSQPTPSDVTTTGIPILAQFDHLFIDIYVEGFTAPFTRETADEANMRIEFVSVED